MKKGQVTIRDIALKLDVSISTVSRALRGMEEVKPETRKAVMEMAQKMNYEPNLIAQSLRSNRTNTLGIIVPDLVPHFFAANISGMQELASRRNYNVMICQSNESYDTEVKNIHTLVSSRVDGLLISLSRETKNYDHLHALYARGIPLVFFDRVCEEIDTTKVIVDDHDGAFKGTEHLIRQGCKRIAHISGPEKLAISKNRLKGYRDALEENNIASDPDLIRHSTLSEEDIIEHVKALLALPNPPDAIFTINDPAAIQAMLVLKERGIKIPDEVAVVGFTNEPASALIEPSLTTLAQPTYEMGQIAAKHALEQIKNGDSYTPQTIILKTELIVRNSSRKKG